MNRFGKLLLFLLVLELAALSLDIGVSRLASFNVPCPNMRETWVSRACAFSCVSCWAELCMIFFHGAYCDNSAQRFSVRLAPPGMVASAIGEHHVQKTTKNALEFARVYTLRPEGTL
jgi:hypothetical protein